MEAIGFVVAYLVLGIAAVKMIEEADFDFQCSIQNDTPLYLFSVVIWPVVSVAYLIKGAFVVSAGALHYCIRLFRKKDAPLPMH